MVEQDAARNVGRDHASAFDGGVIEGMKSDRGGMPPRGYHCSSTFAPFIST